MFDAEKDRFPYDDGYFSTVLCCELVEHLTEDPMHMMAEINRILRPGGHLVLTTPNIGSLRAIAAILAGYHPGFFPAYIRPRVEGEEPEARHNREYTAREIALLFYYAGFEMTLLETGPFRDEPKPEHEWVKHLLARYEMPEDLRGDGIYAVGRKTGPVRERYPAGYINELPSIETFACACEARCSKSRSRSETNPARTWTPDNFSLGWQFFDPQSNLFIEEGAWTPVASDVAPGASASFEISIPFPPEAGAYEIYLSHIQPAGGWAYTRGEPFLRILVEAVAEETGGRLRILAQEITTAAVAAHDGECGPRCPSYSQARANHRPEPPADPFHGAARYPGALSRLVWRCLLDYLESAVAHGDLFFCFRHRACRADSAPTKAAPVSRSIFLPGCCLGSHSRSPWDARPR